MAYFWKIIVGDDKFSIYNPTDDEVCAEFPFRTFENSHVPSMKVAEELATNFCRLLNNQENVGSYEEYIKLEAKYEEIYKLLNAIKG